MIMKLPKNTLKEYGIEFTDEHWIPKCKPPRDLVRRLYGEFKGKQYLNKIYKIKKICDVDGCVCPDCYKAALAIGNWEFKLLEIKELAKDIDLGEFYLMGDKKYLEHYNKDKIDFLKISMDMLYAVVFLKENDFDN